MPEHLLYAVSQFLMSDTTSMIYPVSLCTCVCELQTVFYKDDTNSITGTGPYDCLGTLALCQSFFMKFNWGLHNVGRKWTWEVKTRDIARISLIAR